MTLWTIEGWDHYGSGNNNFVLGDSGFSTNGSCNTSTGNYGQTGLGCCFFQYGGSLVYTFPSAASTVVIGFDRYSDVSTQNEFFSIRDVSGNKHVRLETNGGKLEIKDSVDTLIDDSKTLSLVTWEYIEIKLVVGTSVEVRVDGEVILTDATGDYEGGSSGEATYCRFGMEPISTYLIDNFYAGDQFYGPLEVKTVMPTSDGTETDFTPSTGSDHYALVDETTPDDDDYNEGSNVNEKESYNFTPGANGKIVGVKTHHRIVKSGGSAAKVQSFVRTHSTEYLTGEDIYLPSSVTNITKMYMVNPNTSSNWTDTEVNGMESGLKITGISTTTTTV